MLSNEEVRMIRTWEEVAPLFNARSRKPTAFKDSAFRETYGELITHIVSNYLPRKALVLKTDLWNEGIEVGRDLASYVKNGCSLVTIDVSRYVCESAKRLNPELEVIRGTLLASPFGQKFDFIIDPSTVDHMPEHLRQVWISAESKALKSGGILLLSFDCRLNLFTELFHRLITRHVYPEWTLVPGGVRAELRMRGLRVLREHAIFLAGLFLGTHRPFFPFSRLLRRKSVFKHLKRLELSKYSPILSFLAPQYVMIARKSITV